MSLISRIKRHEGLSTKPYYCSANKLTIGYGRNLEVGITEAEAEYLLANDIKTAKAGAESLAAYHQMNNVRKEVLIEMVFQLGLNGVSKFKKFLAASQNHDWARAAEEMLDSKWARQTPERAKSLAKLFLRGVSER
jgi:lysozyme